MNNEITKYNKQFWNKRGKNNSFFVAGSPMKKANPENKIVGKYRNRTEYKHLKNKINLNGKTLLDLGCGTGRLTFVFAKKCKKVVGVDFATEMIKQAKLYKNKNAAVNTEFYVSELQKYKTEEKFDIIYLGGVLMCINDTDVVEILNNIKNYLKPNGIVINRDTVSLTDRRKHAKEFHDRTDFTFYRTITEVKEIFNQKYETFYYSETYPIVIALNLYKRLPDKLRRNKIILFCLNFGLILQSAFFDKFLLNNKKLYKKVYNNWVKSDYPLRQFYFFHRLKQ